MKAASLEKYINLALESESSSYSKEYINRVCEEYRRRNDAYALITQINQLIKTVQKHRGYTIGLLTGDESYRERFQSLQKALQKRLHMLEQFGGYTSDLVSERDRSNLYFCWQTISNNWQQDNINETLELHSHFVQQLLTLLVPLSADLSSPLLDRIDGASEDLSYMEAFPHSLSKVEVLNFAGKFLPENIELIGKLRALSTHMASVVLNTESDLRKLKFMVDSARNQINLLRNMADRLKEVSSGSYVSLTTLFDVEMKLSLLLSQIENGILSGEPATQIDSRELFHKATEVIDAYWIVANKGFELMRQWHEEEFDFWLAVN